MFRGQGKEEGKITNSLEPYEQELKFGVFLLRTNETEPYIYVS